MPASVPPIPVESVVPVEPIGPIGPTGPVESVTGSTSARTDPNPVEAEADSSPVEAEARTSGAEAVIDLLGLVAYGQLLAFDRMAADARLAPDLSRRAVLSEMAASEINNYRRLAARLTELGVRPDDAMRPYVGALQSYHDSTEPKDWLEALTKAYVGDAIADDFFRDVAGYLTEPDRQLVLDVLHDSQYYAFAGREIKAAITADPKIANRLSMWARRLVGEALSQAGRVAAERMALATLIIAATGDQAAVQMLFKRLTAAHTVRMTSAGLNN